MMTLIFKTHNVLLGNIKNMDGKVCLQGLFYVCPIGPYSQKWNNFSPPSFQE